MALTTNDLARWIQAFADHVAEHKTYLTTLDSAIGDGDHGQNMTRGLRAASADLEEASTPPALLKSVAMALISKTGGASGPLYGTFFMEAAKAAPADTVDLAAWTAMMQAGLDGVKRRGKADLGDKTMVDALVPAVRALHAAADNDEAFGAALQQAAAAAKDGMNETTPLVARKGRASYLGERSKGHQDPGATSTYYLFATAAEALRPA
ncbi:dihydroxyacetone kinase subunit DhaL [Salisaeta longa]|uniref:dihydroxyacetone kinase subunit DhaL n=1 Tax=Salisaeta longa TaxID=503170 RepID=UPI0003B7B4FF|nr:dihydroxyacetone kinase subunit DhaL [Salisaeta longa]